MTNNKPHVRSYMTNKEIQEYINEHNKWLNILYNPKPINISSLFITDITKFNLLLDIWIIMDNESLSRIERIIKIKDLFKSVLNI